MKKHILKILKENLGLKKGEKLLVFTDYISDRESRITPQQLSRREKTRILAQQIAEEARNITDSVVYHEYESLGHHGMEPPVSLWRLAFGEEVVNALEKRGLLENLLSKEDHDTFSKALEIVKEKGKDLPQVVIALANYSTTHTSFRRLLTDTGTRYASMPLFDADMLTTSLDVDLKEQESITLTLAQILTKGEEVKITAPNGTAVTLSIKDRAAHSDTGILTSPGSFGNLPAGEAFIAPVEGTAHGLFVAEWGSTRKLDLPTIFHIHDGKVIKVEGDPKMMKYLEEVFQNHPMARNIAELGIGTNKKATRPDNILEAEKIAGTIHIALGDNSTFGGRVKIPFHQDFILFHPTLHLLSAGEWREVLQNGRLVNI